MFTFHSDFNYFNRNKLKEFQKDVLLHFRAIANHRAGQKTTNQKPCS